MKKTVLFQNDSWRIVSNRGELADSPVFDLILEQSGTDALGARTWRWFGSVAGTANRGWPVTRLSSDAKGYNSQDPLASIIVDLLRNRAA